MSQEQFDSDKFWIDNYNNGLTSGHGSYGDNAKFKADFINNIIDKYNIKEAVELGCGDGNNLGMYDFISYTGYDISLNAIERCKRLYGLDNTKEFYIYEGDIKQSECVLCLDVIYHIFPYSRYKDTIKQVIDKSEKLAIFYTTLNPTKWAEGVCMNDYNFIEVIEELGYKYEIDYINPPNSCANFVVIYK